MRVLAKLAAILVAVVWPTALLADTQAETYGASPSASPSTNLTAIQTALNQTGLVTLTTCGIYSVSGHLIVSGNTYFKLAQCVTLFQANGTNDNMLVNAAYANRGYVGGVFTYVSGASSCMDGIQQVTFTGGGGSPGATGTINVSGGTPAGTVTLTNAGGMYYALPTAGTIATCTGTATFSGGTLTGSSTPVTLTYASGTTVSVAWTSHGLSAGQYVLLQGSSPSTYDGVFKIISITDHNNFVVELLRLPASPPTGQAVAKAADQNITVDGGIWNYNSAGNPSSGMNRAHAAVLGIVQGLTVRNIVTDNVSKYTLYIGAARDVYTDNVGTNFTNSDVIKAAGPLSNAQFHNTWGRNGDDGITIQNTDYPNYYATWTAGDIQDCVIDGVDIESSLVGVGLAGVYFSPGYYMGGMVIKNISGSTLGSAVTISAYGTAGAALDSIEVDNVIANYSIGAVRIQSTGKEGTAAYTVGTVNLSNLTYNPESLTSGSLVITDSNGTIANFTLSGFTINNPNAAASTSLYFLSLDGSFGQINVMNGYVKCGADGRLIGLINTRTTSTYGQVNINNVNMPTGSQVLTIAANVSIPVSITMNNNVFGVSSTAISTKSPVNVDLFGNTFSNISAGAVAIYASVAVSISGSGNQGISTYWTTPTVYTPTVTENLTTAAGSTVPSCSVYTLSNNGSNFTVAVNRGTALPVLTIPSSTIASVVLFPLSAKSEIDSITTKTTSAWSSSGMTTATSTVGDSAGTGKSYTSTAYNLMAVVGNTNFQSARTGFSVSGTNAPLLASKVTYGGSNVIATLTSNQNWNTAPVSGTTDYAVCWKTLP
jgi:hypothetical protein